MRGFTVPVLLDTDRVTLVLSIHTLMYTVKVPCFYIIFVSRSDYLVAD